MLSGESANGKFPAESLAMMSAILAKTEAWMPPLASADRLAARAASPADAVAASSVFTAEKLAAGAIVVTGESVGAICYTHLVSSYAPLFARSSLSLRRFAYSCACARVCVFLLTSSNPPPIPGDWRGDLARLVAKYRPSVPVLALLAADSRGARVSRQLSLHRGVFPTLLPYADALPAAVAQGLLKAGDQVVVVAAAPGLAMSVVEVKSK